MKILNTFEEFLSRIFRLIVTLSLFIQMLIVFFGVIFRYFFNNPQPWIDEISTYLLVVITYLGGYLALRGNRLAGITFIREAFSPKIQKLLAVICDVLIFVLMVTIAIYGFKICTSAAVLKQKTPTLQIPVLVFYCLIPVSGVLMALSMIHQLINHICGIDENVEEEGAFTE